LEHYNPIFSKVPTLRFAEFTDEWEKYELSHFVTRITRRNKNNKSSLPLTISAQYGLVDQISFFNKTVASVDLSGYYLLYNGDFAYNKSYSNDYAWGAVKRLDKYEKGCLSSLYFVFRPNDNVDSDYLTHYFESSKWHKGISNIAGEGARNHGLLNMSVDDYFATKHCLPSLPEQKKIARFFNAITRRIEIQNKIIEDLKVLKKELNYSLIGRIINGKSSNCKIEDVIDYEQPTNYIVKSDKYIENGETPVLTANKAFLLGYTIENEGVYNKSDCIILDDFTLDFKYVNFPFKIKSSAIKILTAKKDIELRYFYEYLLFLGLTSHEHKRHYISEVAPLPLYLPSIDEQRNALSVLNSISKKIKVEENYISALKAQKCFFLRAMFI
jgi:type I restriction enzyme S subunit